MTEPDSKPKSGGAGIAHELALPPALLLTRTMLDISSDGIGNIPTDTPYILAPNHQSMLDGPVLLSAMRHRRPARADMAFVVWSGTAEGSGFIRFAFEVINAIPADNLKGSTSTLLRGIKWIRSGKSLTIFPEGKRSPDGKVGPFIPGVGFIACKAGVPIVPVALRGLHEVMPVDASKPSFFECGRKRKVDVRFLPAVYPDGYDARSLTEAARQAIVGELGEDGHLEG